MIQRDHWSTYLSILKYLKSKHFNSYQLSQWKVILIRNLIDERTRTMSLEWSFEGALKPRKALYVFRITSENRLMNPLYTDKKFYMNVTAQKNCSEIQNPVFILFCTQKIYYSIVGEKKLTFSFIQLFFRRPKIFLTRTFAL